MDFFLTHGLIPPNTLEVLINTITAVKIIKMNIKFGAIAVEKGFISQETLEVALLLQKQIAAENKKPKLIGHILIESGKLTNEQAALVALEQSKRNLKVEPAAPEDPPRKNESLKPYEEPAKAVRISDSSEKIQGGMILEIEDNGMSAYLRKTDKFNNTRTVDDIFTILLSKGIQFGLESEKAVEGFINSSGFRKNRFKIASGTPQVPGKNARIEYYFNTDHLSAGQMDEEGNIDFKDRGEIPKIESQTLLAEKFPFKASENGRDIFGNELLPEPAIDIPLNIKTGVFLSEDETKVYAQISGHPKLSWSGNISVIDTFLVDGDVGYETGHLRYDGNIDITGGLKTGFQIAGFDINIKEVDGGQIQAQGNVTILNGVNDAKIYSRGHVSAKYIHNSEIYCLGNVTVEKEIVDSKIESSCACYIQNGDIVNSAISFNQGVYTKNIGTEKTTPNTIVVGKDLFVVNELQNIDHKLEDLEKKKTDMEKKRNKLLLENKTLHQLTTQMANELDKVLEDKQKIENKLLILEKHPEKETTQQLRTDLKQKQIQFERLDKELNDRFNILEKNEEKTTRLKTACDDLEDQMEELNQEKINFSDWQSSNKGKPVVTAQGRVCAGTVIHGAHVQKEIKETITNVRIQEGLLQVNDTDSNIYEIQIHDNVGRR